MLIVCKEIICDIIVIVEQCDYMKQYGHVMYVAICKPNKVM